MYCQFVTLKRGAFSPLSQLWLDSASSLTPRSMDFPLKKPRPAMAVLRHVSLKCPALNWTWLCLQELLQVPEGVPVVCVGSVWKSWDLLQDAFVTQLRRGSRAGLAVPDLALMMLTSSGAIGATMLAARSIAFPLPCDYHANYNVFYQYKDVQAPRPGTTTNGNLWQQVGARLLRSSLKKNKKKQNNKTYRCVVIFWLSVKAWLFTFHLVSCNFFSVR